MKQSNRKKGFTMVELIVVIVIILVLAAVMVPSLLKYIRKAQEAAAIEECAGVVKMAAVERTQWLADGGEAPTKEEIVQSAGANGEINVVQYNEDDFDVTYMRYVCKNGIVVIYERDKDPQFRIEGENESSPTTRLEQWIKDSTNATIELGDGKTYLDRQAVIKQMYNNNGGLLKVDETFTSGTLLEDIPLYWRPYYVGPLNDASKLTTVLYGSIGNDSSHAGWKAQILYVNGQTYVSVNSDGSINKAGSDIASLKDCKTEEDVKSWLQKNTTFKIKE